MEFQPKADTEKQRYAPDSREVWRFCYPDPHPDPRAKEQPEHVISSLDRLPAGEKTAQFRRSAVILEEIRGREGRHLISRRLQAPGF